MGRLKSDQGRLFYEFRPGEAVPEDHLVPRWVDLPQGYSFGNGVSLFESTSEDGAHE